MKVLRTLLRNERESYSDRICKSELRVKGPKPGTSGAACVRDSLPDPRPEVSA